MSRVKLYRTRILVISFGCMVVCLWTFTGNVAFLALKPLQWVSEKTRRPQISGMDNLTKGNHVISMSLYGDNPKYTVGLLRNAELLSSSFPGWTLRVYVERSLSQTKLTVPQSVVNDMLRHGVDVRYVTPGALGHAVPPMLWRFLVADDDDVERFIIRDADSRLTQRDAAAVRAWVESGKAFHCIRDHPSHAGQAVSGGLWGGWTPKLRNLVHGRSWEQMMTDLRNEYMADMRFLAEVIWPLVKAEAYCSDSVSCEGWPGAHPFPVARHGYEHVGQVLDERDVAREDDVGILRKAGENHKCVPQPP